MDSLMLHLIAHFVSQYSCFFTGLTALYVIVLMLESKTLDHKD